MHAIKLAEDIADLLAPQSGAYYDIWLDGEKYVSSQMEVRAALTPILCCLCQYRIGPLSLRQGPFGCLEHHRRYLIRSRASALHSYISFGDAIQYSEVASEACDCHVLVIRSFWLPEGITAET